MARGDDLKSRTKQFALRIIRLYRALPGNTEAQVIGKQGLRSGTAVGANYRAACCARSNGISSTSSESYWKKLMRPRSGSSCSRRAAPFRRNDWQTF